MAAGGPTTDRTAKVLALAALTVPLLASLSGCVWSSRTVQQDAELVLAAPDRARGSDAELTVAWGRQPVFSVDPALLASGATGAVLRLHVESQEPGAATACYELLEVTAPWTESGATWSCTDQPAGACTAPWFGGVVDRIAPEASPLVIDRRQPSGDLLSFDVTSALGRDDVWGWVLRGTERTTLAAREAGGTVAPTLRLRRDGGSLELPAASACQPCARHAETSYELPWLGGLGGQSNAISQGPLGVLYAAAGQTVYAISEADGRVFDYWITSDKVHELVYVEARPDGDWPAQLQVANVGGGLSIIGLHPEGTFSCGLGAWQSAEGEVVEARVQTDRLTSLEAPRLLTWVAVKDAADARRNHVVVLDTTDPMAISMVGRAGVDLDDPAVAESPDAWRNYGLTELAVVGDVVVSSRNHKGLGDERDPSVAEARCHGSYPTESSSTKDCKNGSVCECGLSSWRFVEGMPDAGQPVAQAEFQTYGFVGWYGAPYDLRSDGQSGLVAAAMNGKGVQWVQPATLLPGEGVGLGSEAAEGLLPTTSVTIDDRGLLATVHQSRGAPDHGACEQDGVNDACRAMIIDLSAPDLPLAWLHPDNANQAVRNRLIEGHYAVAHDDAGIIGAAAGDEDEGTDVWVPSGVAKQLDLVEGEDSVQLLVTDAGTGVGRWDLEAGQPLGGAPDALALRPDHRTRAVDYSGARDLEVSGEDLWLAYGSAGLLRGTVAADEPLTAVDPDWPPQLAAATVVALDDGDVLVGGSFAGPSSSDRCDEVLTPSEAADPSERLCQLEDQCTRVRSCGNTIAWYTDGGPPLRSGDGFLARIAPDTGEWGSCLISEASPQRENCDLELQPADPTEAVASRPFYDLETHDSHVFASLTGAGVLKLGLEGGGLDIETYNTSAKNIPRLLVVDLPDSEAEDGVSETLIASEQGRVVANRTTADSPDTAAGCYLLGETCGDGGDTTRLHSIAWHDDQLYFGTQTGQVFRTSPRWCGEVELCRDQSELLLTAPSVVMDLLIHDGVLFVLSPDEGVNAFRLPEG